MKDFGQQALTSGCYSLEFETRARFKYAYVRYWKDNTLVKVYLCRFGRQNAPLAGEIGVSSRVLSVISAKPQIVGCSGTSPDFIQALDESGLFTHTVQSPFRFDSVCLETLMHKESFSVFERIDFFSVLRGLIVSLGGSLHLSWTLSAPELSKVVIIHLAAQVFYISLFNLFC